MLKGKWQEKLAAESEKSINLGSSNGKRKPALRGKPAPNLRLLEEHGSMEILWNQVKFEVAVIWNWLWKEVTHNPFLALGAVGLAGLVWLILRPRFT